MAFRLIDILHRIYVINKSTAGFTLIEISIVLVIVGLIVGGILVGRDMLVAASVRQKISQVQSYTNAINTFRIKYNCLPGDCPSASDWGLGTNGNGNGIIGGIAGSGGYEGDAGTAYNNEHFRIWTHLAAAGLVEGSYTGVSGPGHPTGDHIPGTNAPRLKGGIDGSGIIFGYAGNSWACMWTPLNVSNAYAPVPINKNLFIIGAKTEVAITLGGFALTPIEASSIDTKIDDGRAGLGKVQPSDTYGVGATNCSHATINWTDLGTFEYNLSPSLNNLLTCRIAIIP